MVAIDLLGFGLSERDWDNDYSHKNQADIIYEVMNKQRITNAILVGHSMGGSIVTHFAYQYPEKVKKLIIK